MVRAPALHAGGHRFEPCTAHHYLKLNQLVDDLFTISISNSGIILHSVLLSFIRREMKQLFICDGAKVDEVVALCEDNDFGIEIEEFYYPEAIEDTKLIQSYPSRIAHVSRRSMHAPYIDIYPGSSDPMIRDVAKHRLNQAYDISIKLDIQHIVLHNNYRPQPEASVWSNWLKRSQEFWDIFFKDKSTATQFHIENARESEPGMLTDVVSMINKSNVDINLDIGNAHRCSRIPVLKWIESLSTQIGYVHMHDNHGEEDERLSLGQGNLPMEDICHALLEYAPNAIWSIEAYGKDRNESLIWLRDHGFLKQELKLMVIDS